MRSYTRVMLLLSIPTLAFITLTASQWVHGLTGNVYAYTGAIAVIPWVALGAVFYALAIVGNSGLVRARRPGLSSTALASASLSTSRSTSS